MQEQRERELKFDVPDGWTVPSLDGVVPVDGEVQVETVTLRTTYYDTVDRDLLAHGMTLRRRTGDADTGWQLKVPDGDARTELRAPLGPGTTAPRELRALVTAVRAGSPLRRAAELDTNRTVHRVLGPEGAVLEVVDDAVRASAFGEATVVSEWREAEIELVGGSEGALAVAAQQLEMSGARPAETGSKLARALKYTGAGAPQPQAQSLLALVQAYLHEQYDVIVLGDVELRRGREVFHPVRVATRRFRSALRVYEDALNSERASALERELRWYAGLLGEARDLQVLRGNLADLERKVPDNERASSVLTDALDAADERARAALMRALSGRRYLAMIRELRAWAEAPAMLEPELPAGAALDFVLATERRLDKRLRRWSRHPDEDADSNEAMHKTRKAAKLLKYAAELAEPACGKRVGKIRKWAKTIQTRLGIAQDCVAASEFLRNVAAEGDIAAETGFDLGVLWVAEQRRLRKLRRAALRKFS